MKAIKNFLRNYKLRIMLDNQLYPMWECPHKNHVYVLRLLILCFKWVNKYPSYNECSTAPTEEQMMARKQELIKEIKRIRVDLYIIWQSVIDHPGLFIDVYCHNAINSLIMTRAWLGELLKNLGEAYPYPNGDDTKTTKIDNAADTSEEKLVWPEAVEAMANGVDKHIARVKFLREYLGKVNGELDELIVNNHFPPKQNFTFSMAIKNSMECRFWFGWLLNSLGKLRTAIQDVESQAANQGQQLELTTNEIKPNN